MVRRIVAAIFFILLSSPVFAQQGPAGVSFSGPNVPYTPLTLWTPTLAFGGGSVGITYTRDTGTYTIVGKVATVCVDIVLSAVGSSSGNAQITNMPVTEQSTNFATGAGIILAQSMTGLTAPVTLSVDKNTVTGELQSQGATTTANISNLNFSSTSVLSGCVVYMSK